MIHNQESFLKLLRAGLWGGQGPVQEFKSLKVQDSVDWKEVYQLAHEQSVQGLVLQGIEELKAKGIELGVPKVMLLQWIGEVQIIEQQNKEMNAFVAELIEKLRKNDIYAILVKGQGIAQCYEKPLWRSSGDVDLLLSDSNYEKASKFLTGKASSVDEENPYNKHLAMTIDGWPVELHGTLRGSITRVDHVIDEVQNDVFCGGNVRSWQNGKTQVFLPAPNEDVYFVFTHILQHFYFEGIGLRQICDWCRLLWTYKESLNYGLLESRIRKAGIMKEWKAFGTFAVVYLGMPLESMPYLDVRSKMDDGRCEIDKHLKRKADRILEFVLESGNFGYNRDISYKQKYPFVIRYAMSLWLYTKLAMQRLAISPRNAIMAWWAIVKMGANAAAKAM